ncbi:MAG: response regulator transcription factor [Candidatus Omnitrophica bacterium]|nr:response regulator transcription factor [Candidatus Omnitrophota bacterium]
MDKILIVNDTPIINKMLKRGLEAGGFAVDTVETGQEGIAKALDGQYDIILLDYNLPDVNGDVICKTVKADPRTKWVPVYYISSMDKESLDVVVAQTGAQGFLDIAIDVDELCGKIKSLLGG